MFLFPGKRGLDSLKLFKVCVLGTFSPRFRLSSSFRIEYNFRWNFKYFYRVLHEKFYRNISGYSAFAPTSAHSFLRASYMHSFFYRTSRILGQKTQLLLKTVSAKSEKSTFWIYSATLSSYVQRLLILLNWYCTPWEMNRIDVKEV